MSKTEWKEYEMSELIEEISMGPFGSNIKVECFTDSGVPVLNGSNLVGFRLNEDTFNYVTEEKATSLGKANAYRGDIVITHRGTLGQIVYIPQNSKYSRYIISQSQFRVRCNEKVIPEYLVYYFHSRLGQHKLLSNASQVGVPSLARPTSTFQKLTISIPSIAKQKEIVKILSSLDDKIELNNAINRNLEEQAQSIFKSWFIDFEPFGGEMPGDWNETRIGDLPIYVTDYVSNGSFASLKENVSLLQNDGFAYFIRNTDLKVGDFNTFVDEHSYHFLEKSKLFGGEIIISNVGDVGSVFLCPKLNKPMTLGNNIIMLRCLKDFQNYFFYMWFKWFDGQISIKNVIGGSVLQKFNKTDFKNIKIHMPLDESLERFNASISPFINKIEENAKENQRIVRVRDELLPKLMSENS